jgi:glycosyltransferase involved in cell wall biosynthesis
MAMEVPVVATSVGGVPELICHGATGLLADAGDADALATALRRLLTDESLRSRCARAARVIVEQRHSFAERLRKLATIYDELLSRETALT